jgi:hypothetical protein
MGEVIRRTAAAVDIMADVETTLNRARVRGGDWATSADARLAPFTAMWAEADTRLTGAQAAAAPAVARLEEDDETSDDLLGRISDEIWNLVGRPGSDPILQLFFPGGIRYYATGSTAEQPVRMLLLAELLESGIHPRLPAERATAFATEIREAATRLEEAVDAARSLRARVELAERMRTAVARAAQMALANLKRLWKADGHSDADIHAVIPDRPSRRSGGGGGPTPT